MHYFPIVIIWLNLCDIVTLYNSLGKISDIFYGNN